MGFFRHGGNILSSWLGNEGAIYRWLGFTRDYHQCEGAFGRRGEEIIRDIPEYLSDMKSYAGRHFDYKETAEVYHMLCSWLEEAILNQCGGIPKP